MFLLTAAPGGRRVRGVMTNGPTKWPILASLFLLTATGLALEVTLTRLFSFLFVQSYVYIVISLSISGIGFGAVLMYYVPTKRWHGLLEIVLFLPVVMLVLLLAVASLTGSVVASLVVTFGIYLGIGCVQVYIFRESRIRVAHLYAADLLGAATGSVIAFFLLNGLGAVDALVAVLTVMALAMTAAYLALSGTTEAGARTRTRGAVSALALVAVAVVVFILPVETRLMPDPRWGKEMTLMLQDPEAEAEIAESRWSAFGRVDVVETGNPLFRTMFIDGGAGTKMVRMENGQVSRSVAQTLLLQYMGGLPLLTVDRERRENAVVIGSGGGIDVVTLLVAGYRNIDAVEINPDFIDVVREQTAYTGGIYNDHERISVHETEGRSFLRTTDQEYDLVLMGLPIIKSARNFGNHALTENYLFTHNAFTEYRTAMNPDGMMVIIAHYRNELLRLVSNALKSFQSDGLSLEEATQRIVTIGDAQNPTLVVRNRPFTPEEREGFKAILEAIPTRPDLNFVPGLSAQDAQTYRLNRGLSAVAAGEATLTDFVAGADEDISWIGDDSPFFYQLSPTLPREMVIVGIAVLAIIAAFATLFAVHLRRRSSPGDEEAVAKEPAPTDEVGRNGGAVARFASFGLIGIGYITVEIAILQKFIVFWQHQTLALAVVLSVILVSSGLGSLISARLRRTAVFAGLVAAVLALLALALVFLSPALLALEDASAGVKVLVTIVLLAPVFVPLGMPFPTLLRSSAPDRYPWMIGFNSVTTLAGGALAMIVALQFGYVFVMLSGMLAYALLIGIIFGTGRVLWQQAPGIEPAPPIGDGS